MSLLAFSSLKENTSSREVAPSEFRLAPGHPKALIARNLPNLIAKPQPILGKTVLFSPTLRETALKIPSSTDLLYAAAAMTLLLTCEGLRRFAHV